MRKTMIFAIDGLDSRFIECAGSSLPTFHRLNQESTSCSMKSTFPPDSSTAWATIYTGMDPSEHGILHMGDAVTKVSKMVSRDEDNSSISGHTFWDDASRHNKRVVVLLPHLGFPAWKVNGIMISRSAISREVSTYPKDIRSRFETHSLTGVRGFPSRNNVDRFVTDAFRQVDIEAQVALTLATQEDWDLFFYYASGLDLIEHFLWSEDVYTAESELSSTDSATDLLDSYKRFDDIARRLIEIADSRDSDFVIVSDHGHGPRPRLNFAVNVLLERKGLTRRIDTNSHLRREFQSALINTALKVLTRTGGASIVRGFLGRFSVGRILTLANQIDPEKSLAFCPPMSGIKTYPFGGVIINVDREDPRYETIRDDVISTLLSVRGSDADTNVVRWARRREDLFAGPLSKDIPDVLFELGPKYGASSEFSDDVIQSNPTSEIVPGTHRTDGAVFMMKNRERLQNFTPPQNLGDLHGILLSLAIG